MLSRQAAGRSLAGAPLERRAIDRLRAALDEVKVPAEQHQRLGIAGPSPQSS